MTQPILDSVTVDGSVEATGFIGSGAQITDIPQSATLDGFASITGGAVVETDTIQAAIEKIEYKVNNSGGIVSYTNTTPVPVAIGGISAGTTFTSESVTEIFNALFYPYQVPTFNTFSISGQTAILEVGTTTNANPSFIWSLTHSENITPNTINIVDTTSSEVLVSNHSVIYPANVTHIGITKSTASSETYTITGTNSHSTIFSRTFSITWLWSKYYGESTSTVLTENGVEGLRMGGLSAGYAGTYSYLALPAGYKWLCYPSSLGTATVFKDVSTNLTVPFETPYILSITNSHGIITNYNCHRSTNALGGAISIVVS